MHLQQARIGRKTVNGMVDGRTDAWCDVTQLTPARESRIKNFKESWNYTL